MINAILVLVFTWGLYLRITLLNASIDYDEAYTFLYYMRQTFLTAISQYNLPNNHLLNSYVGWVMQNLWTPEPWVLRLVPFVIGVGALYVVYLGLKAFFDEKVAWAGSLIAWASYPFVSYSALARGYMYQVFFIFMALHFMNQKKSKAAILCWALGLWALPTTIYPFALCMLAFLLVKQMPLKKVIGFGLKTGIVTFLLYLPALIYVALVGTKTFFVKEPWSLHFFSENFVKTYSFLWAPYIWLLFLLPLIGFFFQKKPSAEKYFFYIFVVFILLILLVNRSMLGYERTWIWAVPFIAAFLIQALNVPNWSKKYRSIAFLIFLIPLALTTTQRVKNLNLGPQNNILTLHDKLSQEMQPGDFLLVSQSTVTLLNYWTVVKEKQTIQELQPFFMSGDWLYSMYRTKGPLDILKEKIGPSRFFAVVEADEDLEKAKNLVKDFTGREVQPKPIIFPEYTSAKIYEL
jgi:hypothetical protein